MATTRTPPEAPAKKPARKRTPAAAAVQATVELGVPIESLNYYDGNPRRGDIDALKRLMKRRGWWGAAVAQVAGRKIIVGNHRLRARAELAAELAEDPTVAKREGWHRNAAGPDAPVLHWMDVDDTEAAEIVTGDNRAADMAHNDPFDLHALLTILSPEALGALSYTSDDLDALLRQTQPPSLTATIEDTGHYDPAKDGQAFWPATTLKLHPDVMARWTAWRASQPASMTDTDAATVLLDAVKAPASAS